MVFLNVIVCLVYVDEQINLSEPLDFATKDSFSSHMVSCSWTRPTQHSAADEDPTNNQWVAGSNPLLRYCVVSLNKTLLTLLSTGMSQHRKFLT